MNTISYQDFDLLIEQTQAGYRARVLNSPMGQARADFVLPFSVDELRSLFGLTGRVTRAFKYVALPGPTTTPLDPQTFGERLFKAVFAGDVGTGLLRSLDEAKRQSAGLRIRLRLDPEVTELADLPWEYLYASPLKRFLALSDQTVLVRYIELAQRVQALQVTPPLKLLVMVANPSDAPPLQVEQEWQHLQTALANVQARNLLTVERLASATMDALQARLRKGDVHLLHYIGHGYFDVAANVGGLVLENEHGQSQSVTATQLATLLHDHTALRLIFLNACEGARSGRADAFAGVAQKLVEQSIPAVLAMQFSVSDVAAITLAQEFYEAIADGYPVDSALAEARKAIYGAGNAFEWGTPVLFSRAADNRLIELPQGNARPMIETKPFEPETIMIPAGPFLLGSDDDGEAEKPRHTIILPAYRIGKTPITNRQYAEFLKRNKRQEEPKQAGWFLRQPPSGKLDHPVVGISWHDARAYGTWLSQATGRTYRLPTEAEWEKAACGPGGRRYPWGEAWADQRCNVGSNDTTPVTTYPDGASPYSCLDLLGNVQEWTQTIWGTDENASDYTYPYDPNDGREDPEAKSYNGRVLRIHRGGSFRSAATQVRCSARAGSDQATKVTWRGFRMVMEV